jgi:trehalose/maltose hydrolase-like predicted phosphorylase
LYVFNRASKDKVSINLLTLRGFDKTSPLWQHFHAIVASIYNSMSYSHASIVINDKIIEDINSELEAKLKVADERINAMETEINKLKHTLAIVSGTLAKELGHDNGRDE